MELKLKINYHQLMAAIKQLPARDLLKLKKDLAKVDPSQDMKLQKLDELLLEGPLMSDEQYREFIKNRKKVNEWRED